MFAAMLHGFTCANLRNAPRPRPDKVRFDKLPQGGNESALEMWGHRADRKPAVQLSPMKPQLKGAFAKQAKSLAYDRRRFDRTMAWAFIKK